MKIKTKDLVAMAFLTAILLGGQVVMGFLPNIEIVSFLIIMYTLFYKKRVFYIIYVFALLEGLIYGFGIWWFMYLYVWSILAIAVLIMRKNQSLIVWCILSGVFGLCFGALCSIPYFISGGWAAGFGYWVTGIPFDIAHCAGNAVVMFVLYKPILAVLKRMTGERPLWETAKLKEKPVVS
ncbi:MAG: hypothetical protein PHC41_05865 [Lachnospiraceae bacterium]|nr:hypothetical protein [Lachnospiraceae bacterium]MDD3615738.1 hypothetical protein [Lachnospiraceae bacterium]